GGFVKTPELKIGGIDHCQARHNRERKLIPGHDHEGQEEREKDTENHGPPHPGDPSVRSNEESPGERSEKHDEISHRDLDGGGHVLAISNIPIDDRHWRMVRCLAEHHWDVYH